MPKRHRTDASSSSSAAARGPRAVPNWVPAQFIDRYRQLRDFHTHAQRYIDFDALQQVGLRGEVETLLQRIGWLQAATVRQPFHVEAAIDFLATCGYHSRDREPPQPDQEEEPEQEIVVTFWIRGRHHEITLAEFNIGLGFETAQSVQTPEYIEALLEIPDGWQDSESWRALTGDGHYIPSRAKASRIRDPAVRAVHRWIARSINGRALSDGTVTRPDLFLLWAMTTGRRCDAGMFFLRTCMQLGVHLQIQNTGHIVLGSFISHLAQHLGSHAGAGATVIQMEPIGLQTLVNIGVLRRLGHDEYEVIRPGQEQQQQQDQAADYVPIAEEHPPPPPEPQPQPAAQGHTYDDVMLRLDQIQTGIVEHRTHVDQQLALILEHLQRLQPFPPAE